MSEKILIMTSLLALMYSDCLTISFSNKSFPQFVAQNSYAGLFKSWLTVNGTSAVQ